MCRMTWCGVRSDYCSALWRIKVYSVYPVCKFPPRIFYRHSVQVTHISDFHIDTMSFLGPINDGHYATVPWYGMLSKNDGIKRHCVRCHKDYSIVSKVTKLCSIPHVYKPEPLEHTDPSTGETCVFYQSECCDGEFFAVERESPEGSGNIVITHCEEGFCFSGQHTTCEEEAREFYNGINILPCLEVGGDDCGREWLRDISGDENQVVVWGDDYNRQNKAR